MLYRLKERIRNIIVRLFMSPKNNLADSVKAPFDVSDYTVKYIINSSVIIRLQKGGDIRYFRECRKHQKLKQYLSVAIDDYFENICQNEQKAEIRRCVLEDLSNKNNYQKFVNMGSVFDARLMEILAGVYADYKAVGLPCFENAEKQEFIPFIQYIQCILNSQKTNKHLQEGQLENANANKQIATYELAKCLGVEGLIPKVEMCKIVGEWERIGTLMDAAPGIPPSEILPLDRKNIKTDTFLRDITNLEYFDALCYQLDHRLDNYHVVKNEDGQIANVVAFDNDATRTFFVRGKLPNRTYAGAGCVIVNGKVNRPYIDGELANRVCKVKKKELFDAVGEYLSGFQFSALWKRIRRLKKAIESTAKNCQDFIVDDWTKVSVEKTADRKYGCTYFNLYLTDTLMLDREKMFNEWRENEGK